MVGNSPGEVVIGVIVVWGVGLLLVLLLLLLLTVTGGVLRGVTVTNGLISLDVVGVKVGDTDDGVDTTGVTVNPAAEGNGEGPGFGLLGGGDGEEVGLSKHITWGLTDPDDGGENVVPLPAPPPAGVNKPPVPLDEPDS